jgi:very-short-patch-repair endonuclease
MAQPDEIRRFVQNRYMLPARELDQDTVTFSASMVQQAIGNNTTIAQVCKALDTRAFLNLARATLIRREGMPKEVAARWTFGVSMRHQRGEFLVAVVKNKRDLRVLKENGWYRVPVETTPKRWPPRWIGFFQGVQWGQKCGINYYAPVERIQRASRRELFPNEIPSRTDRLYNQVFLGPLRKLESPLLCRRPRVIVFIATTWQKFATAHEINDLYDDSPLEDQLWAELKRLGIPVERQWRVEANRRHYYLDFALFCRKGKVDIETDGDSWHLGHPQSTADNQRQNDLTAEGWYTLRFDTQQIRDGLVSYCIPKVQETINENDGLIDHGLVSRRFYTLPEGSGQQLTLFEAKAEYDLD